MYNEDAGANEGPGVSNPKDPFVVFPTDQHFQRPNAGLSNESGSLCCPGAYSSQQAGVGFERKFAYEMSEGYSGRMFGIPPPPGFQPKCTDLASYSGHSGGPMSLQCSQQDWGYPAAVQPMDSLYTFCDSLDMHLNPDSNWDTFEETCSQPMFPVGHNTGHQSFQLPTLLGYNREMNFNIGNYGGGYTPVVGLEENTCHMQIGKRQPLPSDVEQKIAGMPGSCIVDYFEVSLVRLRNKNIIESNWCFAVCTKKPETGQHWLTAFTEREHYRAMVKYNRLITSHLKITVNGPKTVELQASKICPNHAEDNYLFNFDQAETVQLFVDMLYGAKSQIWGQKPIEPNPAIGTVEMDVKTSLFNSGVRPVFTQEPLTQQDSSMSPRNNILDSANFLGSLKRTVSIQKKHNKPNYTSYQEVEDERVTFDEKDVKFKANGKLFVRCSDKEPLACVGEGYICVVIAEKYYDRMVFVSKTRRQVICHHYIYHWTTIKEAKKTDESFEFTWMASAILGSKDTEIPSLFEIKLEVGSDEEMSNFCEVMSESNIKGKMLARSAIHNFLN